MGTVVVGIDGSPASLAALDVAVREAGWRGATLELVYVDDTTPAILHLKEGAVDTRELTEERAGAIWESAAPHLADTSLEVRRVNLVGSPGPTLAEHCRETGAELLVLATRGKSRLESLLIGSTAKAITSQPPCDVLLVRR